jgi:ribosomal protein S12 methylthiotransferase accessory factor
MVVVVTQAEQRVRLKRFLAVGPVAAGQWLVRDGPHRQWTVRGPAWVDRLLPLLGEARSVPWLTDELAHVATPDEIRVAVHDLVSAGVLEHIAAEPISQRGNDDDPIDVYLSRWGIGPAQSRAVRAGCRIGLTASGLLAQDLHAALSSSDLNTVTLPLDELERRAEEFGLLVGAADHPDEMWPAVLSRLAIRLRVPWLYVTTDCETARIGPLFIPHETACWCCFQHRLNSNRGHRELYEGFVAGRSAAAMGTSTVPTPPFVRQALANLAAMEVMRFLFAHEPPQCVGRAVFVRFRDYHTASEAVLKIPGCPECAPERAATPVTPTAGVARPDGEAAPAVRRFHDLLVGRHCGIVRRIREILRRWDDPNVFIVSAELADVAALGATAVPSHSGGVGLTYDDAWFGAIGEAAERYCAALAPLQLPTRECAWSNFNPTEAVDPDTLALFSDEQYRQAGFPIRAFRRDTRTAWLPGWWLTTPIESAKQPCWMPADCVGLDCWRQGMDSPVNIPTSNGLAAGQTLTGGLLAGLCEVIERDAFIVAWFNGLSAPRVDLHSRMFDWLRDLLESHLLWPRIEYHVVDLTTDAGVPVYAAISRGPSEDGTVVSFGAACHPFARLALTKALLEAAAGRAYVRQLVRSQPKRAFRWDFGDVRTFVDHAQFYTRHPRCWPYLQRLASSRRHANMDAFSTLRENDGAALARIAAKLKALGLSACWCELTTLDVAETGLRVVRVLVPGMQPLHGDHRLPFLGGRRHTHPERVFAWAGHAQQHRRFRLLPHPYP